MIRSQARQRTQIRLCANGGVAKLAAPATMIKTATVTGNAFGLHTLRKIFVAANPAQIIAFLGQLLSQNDR
jgi:hypothetical protein